ncbi:MAG TPA: hypothetical protein VF796_00795, partial [Humisphaera sp.]
GQPGGSQGGGGGSQGGQDQGGGGSGAGGAGDGSGQGFGSGGGSGQAMGPRPAPVASSFGMKPELSRSASIEGGPLIAQDRIATEQVKGERRAKAAQAVEKAQTDAAQKPFEQNRLNREKEAIVKRYFDVPEAAPSQQPKK